MLNAGFVAALALAGIRNDPYMGFNFLVEIEGLLVGAFSEASGLEVETEVQEYREGGQNDYVHKLPGPTKYSSNIVLQRGLTDIEGLWTWHQDVVMGDITRRNGSIYLLDAQRIPAMWWNFKDAYPIKWSGPQFNAGNGSVAVEKVELVHCGIEKPLASSLLSAARMAASFASQALS